MGNMYAQELRQRVHSRVDDSKPETESLLLKIIQAAQEMIGKPIS